MHIFNKIKNCKKGFTLIEMLIVILIIVILLAIAVPSVIAYREDSERTADLGAAKQVYTALEAALTNNDPPPPNSVQPSHLSGYSELGDIIYTNSRMDPLKNGIPLVNEAWDFLKNDQFTGYFEYGYNTVTDSIAWVSYHPVDEFPYGQPDTTAANSEVMLYHVEDNVEGYLDELSAPYNAAPYTHE